jgi:hypothetical protein
MKKWKVLLQRKTTDEKVERIIDCPAGDVISEIKNRLKRNKQEENWYIVSFEECVNDD